MIRISIYYRTKEEREFFYPILNDADTIGIPSKEFYLCNILEGILWKMRWMRL